MNIWVGAVERVDSEVIADFLFLLLVIVGVVGVIRPEGLFGVIGVGFVISMKCVGFVDDELDARNLLLLWLLLLVDDELEGVSLLWSPIMLYVILLLIIEVWVSNTSWSDLLCLLWCLQTKVELPITEDGGDDDGMLFSLGGDELYIPITFLSFLFLCLIS